MFQFKSKYLCDFEIKKGCKGPPDEGCDREATRVLVLPEYVNIDEADITVLFVCQQCSLVWHTVFSENKQA